jgi:hypothetical protein
MFSGHVYHMTISDFNYKACREAEPPINRNFGSWELDIKAKMGMGIVQLLGSGKLVSSTSKWLVVVWGSIYLLEDAKE